MGSAQCYEETSLYGSWTIEDARAVGKVFKAKCKFNYSYENCLVIGKVYEITVTTRILPMSPLCEGVGENGKGFECHLERFDKVEEGEN